MSYDNWDLESIRCGLSERACNAIGTLVTTALVVSGVGCFIVGQVCFTSGGWVSNKTQCESIYISGILIMFVIGVMVVFGLFMCIIENCYKRAKPVVVANPVRRRSTSVDEESERGRSKRSPKLSGVSPKLSAKKKNSPLQVLVV